MNPLEIVWNAQPMTTAATATDKLYSVNDYFHSINYQPKRLPLADLLGYLELYHDLDAQDFEGQGSEDDRECITEIVGEYRLLIQHFQHAVSILEAT